MDLAQLGAARQLSQAAPTSDHGMNPKTPMERIQEAAGERTAKSLAVGAASERRERGE